MACIGIPSIPSRSHSHVGSIFRPVIQATFCMVAEKRFTPLRRRVVATLPHKVPEALLQHFLRAIGRCLTTTEKQGLSKEPADWPDWLDIQTMWQKYPGEEPARPAAEEPVGEPNDEVMKKHRILDRACDEYIKENRTRLTEEATIRADEETQWNDNTYQNTFNMPMSF